MLLQVVTLVDLAGHERYFKTTAYGLTGHLPDYACLIVGANAGEYLFDSKSMQNMLLVMLVKQKGQHCCPAIVVCLASDQLAAALSWQHTLKLGVDVAKPHYLAAWPCPRQTTLCGYLQVLWGCARSTWVSPWRLRCLSSLW